MLDSKGFPGSLMVRLHCRGAGNWFEQSTSGWTAGESSFLSQQQPAYLRISSFFVEEFGTEIHPPIHPSIYPPIQQMYIRPPPCEHFLVWQWWGPPVPLSRCCGHCDDRGSAGAHGLWDLWSTASQAHLEAVPEAPQPNRDCPVPTMQSHCVSCGVKTHRNHKIRAIASIHAE